MVKDQDVALAEEIAREKASTLARMCERLEAALAALESAERDGDATPEGVRRRSDLIDEAAEWLWFVVVQREAMGLTNHDGLFRAYPVPPPVRRRMGPRRRR